MNRITLVALTFAVLVFAGFAARNNERHDTSLSAGDETAVKTVLNQFADSWNRHDMKAMHDLDTDDVEWINVVGHDWQGKEATFKGHTAIHKGMAAKVDMSIESAKVRLIAPNVAIAVTVLHFTASTDPRFAWTEASKTRASYTVVKRGGDWKIVHFQNTIIDPNAEKFDETQFDSTGFPPPGVDLGNPPR